MSDGIDVPRSAKISDDAGSRAGSVTLSCDTLTCAVRTILVACSFVDTVLIATQSVLSILAVRSRGRWQEPTHRDIDEYIKAHALRSELL